MAHPNEDRLRELYEAFARGDMEAVLAMCDDDIEFHVPGSSPFSGVHTKADFGDWMSQVMELAGGTFREKAYEAVANDDRGVVLLNHSLERDGGRSSTERATYGRSVTESSLAGRNGQATSKPSTRLGRRGLSGV